MCNLDRQTYIKEHMATLLVTHKCCELYWSLKQLCSIDWNIVQNFLQHKTMHYIKEALKMLGNDSLPLYLAICSVVLLWSEWNRNTTVRIIRILQCVCQSCSLSAAITVMGITEGSGWKDHRKLRWKESSFGAFTSICL